MTIKSITKLDHRLESATSCYTPLPLESAHCPTKLEVLFSLFDGTLGILEDVLNLLLAGNGSLFNLLGDGIALQTGLVHEDAGGLSGADAEEEEVYGCEASGESALGCFFFFFLFLVPLLF